MQFDFMDSASTSAWARDVSVRYYAYILKVASRLAPDATLVEDIAHQAVVEFLVHHQRWRAGCDPKPILVKITKVIAAKHWKNWLSVRPESVGRVVGRLRERAEELLEAEWRDEAQADLRKCLDALPPRERKLIEQHYYQNIPLPEIARNTDRKVNAVYQALFRIREMLKRCIQKQNQTHPEGP